MSIFITSLIIAGALLAGVILYRRYPTIADRMPLIRWLFRLLQLTFEHWELNKYAKFSNLALKYTVVLEAASFYKENPNYATAWLRKFVEDTRITLESADYSKEEAERAANAISMLLTHHNIILDVLASFENSEDIEVKKLTVIAVDVFGELFDIQDKLDRSMYEHIVVAINLALLKLRDKGYSQRTYTEIAHIFVRLKKVCMSYREQKILMGRLNIGELHRRVDTAIMSLHVAMTWEKNNDGK